ncbi:LysM peptidoglycan-binding domain-containing protein [Comamonas aquatica]|uniref:LysM peptidoglycan-binding domain-containing protein n=1 Tax=Comamonas aquatica TaxID=225991 RepID=UPI002448F95B|nr:LysM peptidoglycan-binding domain-containing protein [Comamonas aquatica]MDH1378637.1 LysM peptidoglycan-binding domain-containing protein [Comamonas aquatica]MDH1638450.1 LysM peptidoglycan-binding domain-containing protein [Comamonas aquatica]
MKGTATTWVWAIGTLLCGATAAAQAQPSFPVTAAQRATAQQVAQQGVPLAALNPNAPDSYTVQSGDTLWRIAGLYLRQPWRWPELWGMNLQAIANPHLIYPGQVLYLEKSGGYARLNSTRGTGTPTVKLTPRVRSESLSDLALPTLQMHLIEPFLTEPLVINTDTLQRAPRIIAGDNERIMLSPGDRAYARGPVDAPLLHSPGTSRSYRLFRQATPVRDPITKEILGYEAQYLGQAELERSETPAPPAPDKTQRSPTLPASVHITRIKEEILAGDRLLPEPPRQYLSFVPRAPKEPVTAHVASLYSSTALRYGTQHQVVAINKGTQDGVVPGMVLSLMTQGQTMVDKTDPQRATVKLPDEENGLAMVFRSFDRVSYVLIMDIQHGVQIGDRLISPQ